MLHRGRDREREEGGMERGREGSEGVREVERKG